jgi:hypothetical protein
MANAVLFTGSREISKEALASLRSLLDWSMVGTHVIVGEAPGVDQEVIQWAHKNNYEDIEVHGAYNKLRLSGPGKNIAHDCTYPERNTKMVDRAVELQANVVAIWNGKSRGTLDTINKAKNRGLSVKVLEYKNE